jgi:hypothetical protein
MIYSKLQMRRFIFDGRFYTHNSFEIIRWFRRSFPEASIGIIGDGTNLKAYLSDLEEIAPDWIDISLDGLEDAHDRQRNRIGSFGATLEVLRYLKASGRIPKINILTCLTTLNLNSVLDMIRMLNKEGFQNFFVSPISFLEGYRPSPKLKPSKQEFARFTSDFCNIAGSLSHAWLEIDIYEPVDVVALKEYKPDIFNGMHVKEANLEWVVEWEGNEIHVLYYPLSLTGLVDFILNCNGHVILPKTMAMGIIPASVNIGNFLEWNEEGDYFQTWMDLPGFDYCVSELVRERDLLKPITLEPLIRK